MKYIKLIFKIGFIFAVLSILSILAADRIVEKTAKGKVFNSTENIPYNRVGLLLGTAKVLSNGRINLYYKYRIDAAIRLFEAGKVDYILVSGDNSTKEYDEPTTIKNDLIKKGVPANKIYLDYAGFRTFDSVIRSKEIFGQESITVISQQFHNERAVFIASQKEISAIGYNAKSVEVNYGFKVQLRERFARVKMILDLVFGIEPKFLGEKIEIK